MFNNIIYIFLLHNIECFYAEVEGFMNLNNQEREPISKLEPRTFYWFELNNRISLLYFDNGLEFHERPFLLFILVSWADKNSLSNPKNCQLFTATTFNNFYANSAFFSLLPNEEQKNSYKISTELMKLKISGEVELKNTGTFIAVSFELNVFSACVSLMKTVKIGTLAKNRFYHVEDTLYGLFVETYYIIYQSPDENSNAVNLFRNADLVEIGYTKFETSSEKGKVFLIGDDYTIQINLLQNVKSEEKNRYILGALFPLSPENSVVFDLKENKEAQLQFFLDNRRVYEEIAMPAIEKLSRVGTKCYLLENSLKKKTDIELPIYFFGKEMELSKLVFMFKLIRRKKLGGLSESRTFFAIYSFNEEANSCQLFFDQILLEVYFNYKIQNGEIIFEIDEIETDTEIEYELTQKGTKKIERVKRKGFSAFLEGAIIYNRSGVVSIADPDYTTSYESKSSTKEQKSSKEFKQKYHFIFFLMIFVVLVFFLFIGRLFYRQKKKYSKRRLNKDKK